jgi:hypothetical protein
MKDNEEKKYKGVYFEPENDLWLDEVSLALKRLGRATDRSALTNLAVRELRKKTAKAIEKLLRKRDA